MVRQPCAAYDVHIPRVADLSDQVARTLWQSAAQCNDTS